MSLLDLIQEGNLGLMQGVREVRPREEFNSRPAYLVDPPGHPGRGIADKGRTIRLPSHLMDTLATLSRSSSSLLKALGNWPTAHELADDTGIAIDKVHAALRAAPDLVSLSAAVGDDGDHELGDLLADPTSEAPFQGRGGLDRSATTCAPCSTSSTKRNAR